MKKNIIFGLGVLLLFLCTPLLMDYLPADGGLRIYLLDTPGIRGPFLSIPRLLVRLGIGEEWSCRLYLLVMNLLCCLTSYAVCRRIAKNPYAALAGSICYSFSIYSVFIRYEAGSMGEIAAFALLPLIALGVYELYLANTIPAMVKGTLVTGTGLAALFYASIPVAMIVCAFLLPVCLFPGERNRWYQRAGGAVAGLGAAAAVSLPVLLPFFRAANGGVRYINDGKSFWERGLLPVQLFQVFFGYNGGGGEVNFTLMGVGLPLLTALAGYLVLCVTGILKTGTETTRVCRILAATACASMLFSLELFPWDRLAAHNGTLRLLLEQIGYPHRFLIVAALTLSILASVLGAWIMESRRNMTGLFITGVVVLNLLSGVYLMNDLQYMKPRGSGEELLSEWAQEEYLLYIAR